MFFMFFSLHLFLIDNFFVSKLKNGIKRGVSNKCVLFSIHLFFQHFLTFYFCFRSMLQGETSFLIKFRLSSLISIFNNSFVKIKSIFWKVFFFYKDKEYTLYNIMLLCCLIYFGLLLRKLNC